MSNYKCWIITFILIFPIAGIIAINHNRVKIPMGIDMLKVVPGKTTVREFEKIVGSTGKIHTCKGSEIYLHIDSKSFFQGREIEIVGKYRGVNSGYSSGKVLIADDGDSIIKDVKVEYFPVYNKNSDNIIERYFSKILDWEYSIFN